MIILFSCCCGSGGGESDEREFPRLLCGDITILALPVFFSSSLSSRLLALYFPSSVLCRFKVYTYVENSSLDVQSYCHSVNNTSEYNQFTKLWNLKKISPFPYLFTDVTCSYACVIYSHATQFWSMEEAIAIMQIKYDHAGLERNWRVGTYSIRCDEDGLVLWRVEFSPGGEFEDQSEDGPGEAVLWLVDLERSHPPV